MAQLAETVRELPKGLDTIVGRQGVRLSGGQRQRLAIARVVLSTPQVVSLDEATSALDAETEARLHEALRGFLKNRTTLIIAHRLSAVKQADRAYVFDGGQIIEEGMRARGRAANCWTGFAFLATPRRSPARVSGKRSTFPARRCRWW